MSTYAIIETGGKQYRVEEGATLLVDRLAEDEGAKVALRPLMLRTDDDVVLDTSGLEKVKVEAKVAGHERGEKIRVFTYKAKNGSSRRRKGYRSELTKLEVTEVKQLSRKPAKKAASEPAKKKAAAEPAKKAAASETSKKTKAEAPKQKQTDSSEEASD